MQSAGNATSQLKLRHTVEWILILVIGGALIWIIWNYKSMPVAYTFEWSQWTLSIRAPWGKPGKFAALATQPAAAPNAVHPLAPPIKLNAQGNPERGSSYRLYRCFVDGYPTFSENPCDGAPKSHKSAKSNR
jgi:hypothetical protein